MRSLNLKVLNEDLYIDKLTGRFTWRSPACMYFHVGTTYRSAMYMSLAYDKIFRLQPFYSCVLQVCVLIHIKRSKRNVYTILTCCRASSCMSFMQAFPIYKE